jgi:hypothetical protein
LCRPWNAKAPIRKYLRRQAHEDRRLEPCLSVAELRRGAVAINNVNSYDDLKALQVDGQWTFVHQDGSPY